MFCAHAPGYYLTFVSFALFDLSNIRFSKKLIFTCCSILTDFCHYLHLPIDLFLFEFFWSEKLLEEFATVDNVLIHVELELKQNQKWIYYLAYTNVANENCVKFCMKEVFKCRERRMMWSYEGWTKLMIGDDHVTPRNIQEVQASKLGDAKGTPFFINKNIRSSFKTLYFYCFICYVFFLERLYFLLSIFFSFVCCK
jgi:hypothetical protein